MITDLHNIMPLMNKVIRFLERFQQLNYSEDFLTQRFIKESKEVVENVEELKSALWKYEKDKRKNNG
tara:strand:+ start:92 stop:292 length:201 start_codon:yes stop_codon:yes gene_type:complete